MFPRIDKGPIEYTLEIGAAWNVPNKRECLRFQFRTTEDFHHFQYRIAIDHKRKKNVLEFSLRGLTTGDLTLPAVGKAEGIVDLFDLEGDFDIVVVKPGNIRNAFGIAAHDNKAKLLRDIEADDPFLDIEIHE
jgi:hypothetical protein